MWAGGESTGGQHRLSTRFILSPKWTPLVALGRGVTGSLFSEMTPWLTCGEFRPHEGPLEVGEAEGEMGSEDNVYF